MTIDHFPGFGDTPSLAEEPSIAALADSITAFMATHRPDRH